MLPGFSLPASRLLRVPSVRLGALIDPNPLALVPHANTPVATDALFTVNAGFNEPDSGERVQGWSRLPAS